MIRINVFIQVTAENREATILTSKKLVNSSQQEEGCIAYDIFESSTRADVLMICETWKDQASLDKHEKTEHFVKLIPEIQKLATLKIEKFNF